MASPVRGFFATRARRWVVLKVPKPTNVIASPFLSARVMLSSSESIAAAALILVAPVSWAMLCDQILLVHGISDGPA